MEKYVISGGKPLRGEVSISGFKNAAVAILPATVLANDVCILENVPDISDVDSILMMITSLGAKSVGSVSKKTDYLITNEASGSSKYKKAVELSVPIITEDEFISNYGL